MKIVHVVLLFAAVSAAALTPFFAAPSAAQGAPAVTGVAVTSSAGADATYAPGEKVRVTVTFSEAVDVTGAPTLAIDMDPADWGEKRAAYESGSGTASLVFAHEVVEPNLSTRGVAVLADTLALSGGTIRSAATGADASLGHAGLAHDPAHKVDWRLSTGGDTTPPRLVRGEVDGATMRLFFSEALDPRFTGGRFLVDVARETPRVGFHASGAVSVSGNVVTVGLGAGNPRAQAGRLEGNLVGYLRRADGGGGALRDLAGNPVAAPHVLPLAGGETWRGAEEWRFVKTRLANLTGPAVTGVALVSDAGADGTYALGETVRVAVTFSEAVAVTGAPRLKLDLGGGAERWAVYESGGGAKTLAFAYAVARGDASSAGVAVLANTLALDGGTIRAAARSKDADLAHGGLGHDANHKVDGTPDTRPPRLSAARVNGATLTLSFDEPLGAAASPSRGAFTVRKSTPVGAAGTARAARAGTASDVALAAAGAVAVSGSTVTLTLAEAVSVADTGVTVSYARSASGTGNRLRDEAGNEVASFANQPVANNPPDTTPPRLVRGEIDGGTVTLYFSEALDPDSVGGYFFVSMVRTSGLRISFHVDARDNAEISGNTVRFGFGSAFGGGVRARPGVSNNFAFYCRPADPAAKQLRDLAGNPIMIEPITGWTCQHARLDNLTGPPTVTSVAVSSDAGADRTYARGETIRVRLTFSEAVNVTGTPRVKIDFSTGAGDEKWAAYESGSGAKALEFAYTVADSDLSAGGVAVLANTLELNGGAIRGVAKSEDAAMPHGGLAHNPDHRVDGRVIVSGVAISSEAGDDDTYGLDDTIRVRLTFSEAVAVTGTPRVKLDFRSRTGDEKWAAYVSGNGARTLQFAYTVAQGDASTQGVAVLANTLEPGGGAIRSAADGKDARLAHAGLAHDPSHRVETTPPTLSMAFVNGTTLKLSFNESLGAAASLANGAFTVKKTPQGGGEQTVGLTGTPAIGGASVTLTLANAVLETDTDVKVSYERPASGTGNRLRDEAGNEAAGFSDEPVTNVAGDITPPRLVRGEIDGGTVTLFFSEPLDPDSMGGYFRVSVQNTRLSDVGFTATGEVNVNGQIVTVGLGEGKAWAKPGLLKLNNAAYCRPADPAARQLRDLAGNPVKLRARSKCAAITLVNVTEAASTPSGGGSNGPPSVTGVEVTSDAGADATYGIGETVRVTLTFSEGVTVTGSPKLSIDMDPADWGEKRAAYESGSGTTALVFAHEVVEPNYSTQGIAVLANTLALNGGTIRSAAGADAALGHGSLGHDANHKVDWRPAVSVADARANEGAGASVDFAVSLSRAAPGTVTVDYATADGTARAGEDYAATSGTLTFAAGESSKTVRVPVLDDSHDEGEETFTLSLSNATGARVGDGEATGTIVNTDEMPRAWLARFGRAAAEHVTGAIGERLRGSPATRVTLGGHALDLGANPDALPANGSALLTEPNLNPRLTGGGPLLANSNGFGRGLNGRTGEDAAAVRELSMPDLLLASSFHMASAEGAGGIKSGRWSAWGRGARSSFEGVEGALTLKGDVTTATLGFDYERGPWLAGVALSRSSGDGSYEESGRRGEVESVLTGVYPYARYRVSESLALWGVVGFGAGDMTLSPEGTSAIETDIETGMAAAGARGVLLPARSAGGFELALRADLMATETASDAADNLVETEVETSRLRLLIEASRSFRVGAEGVLTPSAEIGLRYDGGDAETGSGLEMGGSLRWTSGGLTVEVRARGLMAHSEDDYEEWGVSGSVQYAPGADGRGFSMRAGSAWGAAAGGAERLWSQRPGAFGGGFAPGAGLDAEAGYGFGFRGGLLTPYTGVALSDSGDTWRAGARWKLGAATEVSLEANLTEPASGDDPESGLLLKGSRRW